MIAGAAALFAAAWAAMWALAPFSDTRITDVHVYAHDAALLAAGAMPYSPAFPFEYPPLALAPMGLAHALGGAGGFETAFGVLMGLAGLATLVALGRLAGPAAAWAFAVTPLLAGAVLRTHFDLVAAALLAVALLAFDRRRTTVGFALIGVGAATKGFPAVLVPLAFAWLWAQGARRAALAGAAAFAVVAIGVSAPFLGAGYADAFRYHRDRPIQIESTPAMVVDLLGGAHVTGSTPIADRFGSNGLEGGPADLVERVFTVLELAALAALTWLATRSPDPRHLVGCGLAAVVAFVALGKVLSPQYVAWLLPASAVLLAWRRVAPAALLALAVALTQVEFPRRYAALVRGDHAVQGLVALRDALLLAALGSLIATAAGSARWRRRAAAPSSAPAPP